MLWRTKGYVHRGRAHDNFAVRPLIFGVPSGAVHALLDRGVELTELRRRLDEARAGAGRVIVVEGPAGIGKSVLLGAATDTPDAVVLRARAHPLEQDAAWAVARQLFGRLRSGAAWSGLTTGTAALAERALAPESAEPAATGDAMHAAVRGLVWLLTNLCERSPVVLAVDDVHWADAASLHWLSVLASRSMSCRRLFSAPCVPGSPQPRPSSSPTSSPVRRSRRSARAPSARMPSQPSCARGCRPPRRSSSRRAGP